MMMTRESKLFMSGLFFSIFVAVGAGFYRFIVTENYGIVTHLPCDPAQQSCFVADCDPETQECSDDPAKDRSFYSILHKIAKNIPRCDIKNEECVALFECRSGEQGCEQVWCDPSDPLEGDRCSDASDIPVAEIDMMPSELFESMQ